MKANMEHFPTNNPNPMLSVEKDGTVSYSNEAGEPLLHEWGVEVGENYLQLSETLYTGYFTIIARKKWKLEWGKAYTW